MTDDTKTPSTGVKTKIPATGLTPEGLAHAIYDEAIVEAAGDKYEASITVMRFLTEALIYAADVSSGGDETQRKGVLERLAKMIVEAPLHPIAAAAADEKKKQP